MLRAHVTRQVARLAKGAITPDHAKGVRIERGPGMKIESVRDLKLELAREVFAPLVRDALERVRAPRLGAMPASSPLQRVALGIARGSAPGEYAIAVRLQEQSPLLQSFVARIVERVGREVDISFVGRLKAFDSINPADPASLRQLCRPLLIGCSLAHVAFTAGTLGLIAQHRKTGRAVIVSNSHVLAQGGLAKVGDAINQPGPIDGGGANDHVGALLDFAPFRPSGGNLVDAAIAVTDDTIAITPNFIAGLGAITVPTDDGATPLLPGAKVFKLGRTTGLTQGTVTAIEVDDIAVDYDTGPLVFDDQIEITGVPGTPFSDAGDSGSLVIDEQLRAIGLIFCGNAAAMDGAGLTFANHLPKVMSALDLVSF